MSVLSCQYTALFHWLKVSVETPVLPYLCTTLSHWFLVCVGLSLYCPFPLVPLLLEPVCVAPSRYFPFSLVPCLLEQSVVPHLCAALSCWFHVCCPISILPFPIGSTSVLACLITAPSHGLHVCVGPFLYCPFALVPHRCWNLSVLSLPCLLEHVCVAPSLYCPFMLVTCLLSSLYCPFSLVPHLCWNMSVFACLSTALSHWYHVC